MLLAVRMVRYYYESLPDLQWLPEGLWHLHVKLLPEHYIISLYTLEARKLYRQLYKLILGKHGS